MSTATTPGSAARGRSVDSLMRACACGRAHEAGMQHAGQRDVVEIAAAPGDELRVLDPRHRRAEIANAHGASGDEFKGGQ